MDHASAPQMLRRLPYLFSLAEAAAVAVLPVPDAQGAAGFPRMRRGGARRVGLRDVPDASESVLLGELVHEGRTLGAAALPLAALNRHALVVGAPGSGKTTTVLSLLARLWVQHRIPFLAISQPRRNMGRFSTRRGLKNCG